MACLASRRRAHALVEAHQHAQQHAFIFTHAAMQPICSMIMFIPEQWLLACSKRDRRANATRAAPPFSRLQNACHCPTCSTSCSCRCSPGFLCNLHRCWLHATWCHSGAGDEYGPGRAAAGAKQAHCSPAGSAPPRTAAMAATANTASAAAVSPPLTSAAAATILPPLPIPPPPPLPIQSAEAVQLPPLPSRPRGPPSAEVGAAATGRRRGMPCECRCDVD
jgi:hypothetical protein